MNSLSLPVVHPAFQRVKRSGRFLHLAAGGLLLVHAIAHFKQPHSNPVYLGCLLLIALDIFILVFAGRNIITDMPGINLFFRLVEVLFFAGIAITTLLELRWTTGLVHVFICLAYAFLFYCEKKLQGEECVGIHHTGISVPSLPENKFFIWAKINHIQAQYDSITINTSLNKTYRFDLQQNLAFEEMDQIHEFCRHYLGVGS